MDSIDSTSTVVNPTTGWTAAIVSMTTVQNPGPQSVVFKTPPNPTSMTVSSISAIEIMTIKAHTTTEGNTAGMSRPHLWKL